jgi:DNA-binding beta-propeller fold protein YncE
VGNDYRTIQRTAGPFNFPTNLALAHGGEMFITDGYGNCRVHKYSPDGRLLLSWGEPGAGPGQFHLPHGITVDRRGLVYVADRENSRVQVFSPDGDFLREWTGVARPCQVSVDAHDNFYVAEIGYRAGVYPGNEVPPGNPTGGRLTIYSAEGDVLARWGGGDRPCAPGDFFAPHDVCVDSHGDIYVGEVTMSAGGNKGIVPRDCHSLQKFVRVK